MIKLSPPQAADSQDANQPRPRRKKRSRWVFGGLAVTGLFIYFLPAIVAWGLPRVGARVRLSQDLSAKVDVGSAALSWGAPVLLTNVSLKSPAGDSLASIDSVTTERSLWNLIFQADQPMEFDLKGFRISLTVPDPQSRTGKLDLALLASTLQTFQMPRPVRPMVVTVSGGQIDFHNSAGELVETWAPVDATYQYDNSTERQQTLSITLPDSVDPHQNTLTVTGRWTENQSNPSVEELVLETQGEDLSLAPARSWLETFLGPGKALARCSGKIAGTFHRQKAEGWTVDLSAHLDLVGGLGRTTNEISPLTPISFSSPANERVDVEIQSQFSQRDDQLSITRLHLGSENSSVDVQGRITELSGQELVDVTAEVNSPGLSLIDYLPESLRSRIRITGSRFSQIALRGALSPEEGNEANPFEFAMLVAWDRVDAYGLTSQNGRLRLALSNGQLTAEPIDVTIGGGRLVSLPALDVNQDPPVLLFSEGILLENVGLTQEVCRDWLKYVSPVLADATAADGRFTLSMNPGTLVLGHPEQGRLSGVLTIHQAQVRPGPLAIEILGAVSQFQGLLNPGKGQDLSGRTVLAIQNEPVAFELKDGRVYHDEFGFSIGDARLSTTGSVGLDETLALLLTMPIPDNWAAAGGLPLKSLQDEAVQLSIRGTIDRPLVDMTPLAEFGQRIGIKAGAGLLERLLEGGRDRRK